MADPLFPGFDSRRVDGAGAALSLVVGGSGPPLLLVHGYPQTHAMWHKIAPSLARDYTVVCADLRGYGDSDKPPSDGSHAAYSKRAMATDFVALMHALGESLRQAVRQIGRCLKNEPSTTGSETA